MLILLTGVNVISVCACSPVIYTDTTVITIEGEEFDNSPDYNYDLLFNKNSYSEYYQETVNNQFIIDHPNYESFTFLDEGEWVSYKAHYSHNADVWELGWNHEFSSMRENSIQEYKIIVFDDDGNVVRISPIYDKDDFGLHNEGEDFGSVAHTFDENTEEFGEKAIGNGCDGWGNPMNFMPILIVVEFGIFLTAIIVVIIKITRKFKPKSLN